MIDAAGIVDALADGETYMVTRSGPDTYDAHGARVPGAAATPFAISAVVYPPSGRDLQRVPDGLWTKQLVAIVTATQLRTPEQVAGGTSGDVVTIDGEDYQVQSVDPWNGFCRAVAMRVGS